MRSFLLTLFLLLVPFVAQAIEPPAEQVSIGTHEVLRGQFMEEHRIKGNPVKAAGRFTLAPDHGLIWNIEQPFPTTTIITPHGSVQNIGGIIMKLPVKNLHHLYDMIGGALAGNWDGLANDFTITHSGNADHWQMLLTPRTDVDHSVSSYATITVSGSRFVENIAMMKTNGDYDKFSFAEVTLSSTPLPDMEVAVFNEASH